MTGFADKLANSKTRRFDEQLFCNFLLLFEAGILIAPVTDNCHRTWGLNPSHRVAGSKNHFSVAALAVRSNDR